MVRFRLDGSVRRFGTTTIGGSPLKLFRLTERGADLLDRIVAADDVRPSRLTDALVDAGAIHPVAEGPGSHRFTPADVTVVVPTLGPPRHRPARALVVDDGSQPPVDGAAVRLPRTRGPAAARNAGLAAVTTPVVAFVDADVALSGNWFEPLLGHFDDDRVALVAPRVRTRTSPGRRGRYERRHGPLDLGPSPARVRAGTRVSYVPSAAVVCRVDALRTIGGFDESLRFGEDVDLAWRLDAAGWRCRYDPSVEVEHEPRSDWRSWILQRVDYGSSAGPLDRRHPGALAPVRTSGWSVAVWALAALGHPVVAGAVGVGTGAALARKLPTLPPRVAVGLATAGTLHAGGQLADAVRRAWWPLLALLAIRSARSRRVLLTAFLAAGHPIRVVDDVAYSVGLWRGAVRERTIGPLLPQLTSWPGRRTSGTASSCGDEPLPSAR